MKSILLSFTLVFNFLDFVQSQGSPEQALLSKVNPHWKDISLSANEALLVNQCKTNRDLIELHLTLVTKHLTLATSTLSISADRKQKRLEALSELAAYYQHGIFPLNTKYKNPTPIFVDEAGTRCAVGQLIDKSGHEDLVDQISRESNLSYVAQLNQEYDALGNWATENGFSVEELSWIQPQYGYVCNPTLSFGETVNVSCHGGSDGGFLPDFTQITTMLGFDVIFNIPANSVFYLDSVTWIPIPDNDCLKAGLYKQNIIAASVLTNEVDTVEYFVEILEPDPITATYQVQGDLNQCEASIEGYATGGTPPYEYILYDEDYDTIPNTNLCPGVYWMEVKDNHQCSIYDSLNLLSSGINNPKDPILFKIFPNPTDGLLQLQTNQNYPVDYTLFTILGETIGSGRLTSNSDQINLKSLVNGTYYVRFENASKHRSTFQQFVKL